MSTTPASAPAASAPAPAATPAPAPAPVDDQAAFGDAFAAATADAPAAAAPSPAPTPAPSPAPAPAPADSAAAPAPADNAAAPAPADNAAAPAPADSAAAPAAQPSIAELMAQIAELRADRGAAAPAPAAPAPAPPSAPAPPLYTAEEQTTIEAYRKEWGDVAAGEALVRRAEYANLIAHVFNQIGPVLDDLRNQVAPAATHTTLQQLESLVPDYHDIRDHVLEWVDKQPPVLKAAYEDVTDRGTPQDVAALCEVFRKSTGWKKPGAAPAPAPAGAPAPAAPAPAPAAAAPAPAVSAEAAAAARSMAPVVTGRTGAAIGPDVNDFAGAFKEFAADAQR